MDKEKIRETALRQMRDIEDRFEAYVPHKVQEFYLLQHLIAYGPERYLKTHGLRPLDETACADGKDFAGYSAGLLTDFECDCIVFLNETVQRVEAKYERRKQFGIVSNS